jgi:molybdenum cofactor biosynthesis enzyme MoaA
MAATASASTDPKPDSSIQFLRASVIDSCNLSCVYCPKESGMENHTPPGLKGYPLTIAQYQDALRRIAETGVIRGVSFTGGEPTLNAALPELVRIARDHYDRVELTTNGKRFLRMVDQLAGLVDVVKVSLDSADRATANRLTRGHGDNFQVAVDAITAAVDHGMTVGINIVAMRSNRHEIPAIVDLARSFGGRSATLYVSVLDLYYSAETRQFWQDEFMPVASLAQGLRERLGPGQTQDRRGCAIDWIDDNGVQIRLKDSHEGTYRAPKCGSCPMYCQEGFYGLKLSAEGWVTGCPTGRPDYGVHLDPTISDQQARQRLEPLLDQLRAAAHEPGSFDIFLERNNLNRRTLLPVVDVT